ncbi:MAG: hypothetical protein WDO24_00255 [Pseudomonadota bacterium]
MCGVAAPRGGTRLRQDTMVHVHHGAADVDRPSDPARYTGARAARERARPARARSPDPCARAAIASSCATARRSAPLAGGRVLDPFVPTRGRRLPSRLAQLRALEIGDVVGVLAAAQDGIDLGRYAIAANLPSADAERLWSAAALVKIVDGETTLGVAPADLGGGARRGAGRARRLASASIPRQSARPPHSCASCVRPRSGDGATGRRSTRWSARARSRAMASSCADPSASWH